jgi:hypothetical protein
LVGGGVAAAGAAGGAATIGGVAGLIGVTSATTAAIVNAGVGTALVLGASYAMAKLSPTPRQPRPADGTVEYKAPLAPRFFPYGRCKLGGPVLFLETADISSSIRLLKIVAFGTRELAVMDPFYIDGTAVTLGPDTVFGTGSDGFFLNWTADGSHGQLWTYLGKDSQAAAARLISDYPGWTSDHRLRGIPYVFAELESATPSNFQEAFPAGESQFNAVGGVKLYDPRLDTTNGGSGLHRMDDPTTWAFSENQRLACLDWITWKDGYAKDWARIDWASWVPQIAMADENVALKSGATEKRYRIATIVSLNEPKGRVLRRIMDAGDQQLYTTNAGLIGSRGGVWQTPSVSLSAAEILEGQFTHGVGMMDRINEFQLTAMLPSHDYAEVELAPWSNTADPEFIDGILRSQPLDLTQVPSNSQAQRLAKIRMAKVNPRWSGSVRTSFAGLDALGEAAVNLSFDELDVPDGSFDGPFLVNGKIGFLADRTGMTVSLSSIDPACYDWSSAEEHDAPPLPDAPYNTVAPVASGSLTVGSVLSCTTGTWTMSPTGYAYQWKRGAVGIGGATSSTYTTVTADGGALLSCVVTATNAAGSGYATSNALTIAAGPVLPANTVLPAISGTPTVGQTLTASTGTWTGTPTITYGYQWKRAGTAISGATSSTYLLVTADLGTLVTVTVTATNGAGSTGATSASVGPIAAAPFAAVAVNFDGTNDWLTRGAQFASAGDVKTGLVSLWFNKLGGDGVLAQLFGTTSRFSVRLLTTNVLDIVGSNAAGATSLDLRTTPTYAAGSGWKHILASWDLNATTGQLYVNDAAPALSINTRNNDIIDYTNGDWSVGALVAGTSKLNGDLAEVFFHPTFLDLSVTANRRLFISATGKPVSLGANGSTPLGVQPALYLGNPLASWHTNLGSDGGMTLHGTLTSASTTPN